MVADVIKCAHRWAFTRRDKISNSYAAVSALIFALVAIGHVMRLVNRWTVAIGPYNVSMNALVVSALIVRSALALVLPGGNPLEIRY
jgi:hypothetical protein